MYQKVPEACTLYQKKYVCFYVTVGVCQSRTAIVQEECHQFFVSIQKSSLLIVISLVVSCLLNVLFIKLIYYIYLFNYYFLLLFIRRTLCFFIYAFSIFSLFSAPFANSTATTYKYFNIINALYFSVLKVSAYAKKHYKAFTNMYMLFCTLV